MSRPYPEGQLPFITNEDLPRNRPVHLIAGMTAIAQYTQVEAFVSVLLTDMASADPKPIAAIYAELRQGQIQAKALRAVAKAMLMDDDVNLLGRLMKLIKVASDGRDQLAHRMWMFDEKFPADVVLADPAIAWTTSHQVRLGGGPGDTTIEHATSIQKTMVDGCRLWSLQELEAVRANAVKGVVGLQAFSLMLRAPDEAMRSEERQKVLNVLTLAGL